jgi:hypothetical protein
VEALWRRVYDADTLIPLAEYANSSSFEDPSDRRNAKEKYNWWGLYLAERKAQLLFMLDVFEDRLDRYRSTMESTEKRRQQADSRRARCACCRQVSGG